MNMTWKAVAGVLLIFVLGCIFGGVSTLVVARHHLVAAMQRGPDAAAPVLERRLTRGMDLSAQQKDRLHGIIVQYLHDRVNLQKTLRPQVRALNQDTMKEIDAVLTPEEQARFRDNVARFDENTGRRLLDLDMPPTATATNAAIGNTPADAR
jgi:hypothetical protein